MEDELGAGCVVTALGLALLVGGVLFLLHLKEPKYRQVTPSMQATITALKAIPTIAPTPEPTPYPTYGHPDVIATEVEY